MNNYNIKWDQQISKELSIWLLDVEANTNNTIDFSCIPKSQLQDIKKYKIPYDQKKRLLARCFLYEKIYSVYGITNFDLGHREFHKPFLIHAPEIHFNFSYSNEFLIVAISLNNLIGVDIEKNDSNFNIEELIPLILCEQERNYFHSLSPLLKVDFFYKVFTKKEAILKCFGTGFSYDPLKINTLDGSDLFGQIKYELIICDLPVTGYTCSYCRTRN